MGGRSAIRGVLVLLALGGLVAAAVVAPMTAGDEPPAAPKKEFVPAPAKTAEPAAAATLRVVVLDAKGKPVPGANVHSSIWTDEKGFEANRDQTTDADGRLVVALPKTMEIVRLWAGKASYAGLFANWEQSELAGGKGLPAEYTFRLEASTTAAGRVVGADGRPVAGACIEVEVADHPKPAGGDGRARYDSHLAGPKSGVTTDADGRWRIANVPDNPEVELVLRASHPDFVTPDRWTRAKQAGLTTQAFRAGTATLTLKPGVVVRGRVTAPDGKPVKDAVVVSGDDPYDGTLPTKFATDADGAYRLPAVAAGKTTVTVIAPGFAPQLRRVEATPGLTDQNFRMGPGKPVRLRFVDAAGRPVPKVYVGLKRWQGSKSISSNHNPNHPKVPATGIPARADADGVWAWPAAPDGPVSVEVYAKGFLRAELDVTGGEADRTVVLKAEHRVTGAVTDAVTGKPVPKFAVMPVTVFGKNHLSAARFNATEGKDGRLDFLATRLEHPSRLRIEAPGYRTQDGPEFRVGDAGGRVQDFRLQPSPPVSGRVVDAAGQPVERATVQMATPTESIWSDGDGHSTVTDVTGRFTFPDPGEPFGLVVQTPTGTARAEFPAGRADAGTLTVRPWAAVRGTFHDGGKPVSGATVFVHTIAVHGPDALKFDNSLQAVTGADGRFELPRVPPGPTRVSVHLGPWRDEGFRSGPSQAFDLQPGGKLDLPLGSGGATVTGTVKLTGTGPAGLDCQYSLNYLVRRECGVTPPAAVAAAGFDARTGWREAWDDTPEGHAYLATLRHWFVKLAPDGTFRVSGVPAGEYDLSVRVYEKPEGCLVDPVARKIVRVTVTAADAARGELAVPAVEAEVKAIPQVGDTPTLTFQRADGTTGTLADVRGKHVVVHFWASWCGPCKKQWPAVQKLHERYAAGGLSVLSLSADDDAEAWQAAVKKLAPAWPQGRGATASSIPSYWLLDPAGKIVAKPADADALAAEVAARLKK